MDKRLLKKASLQSLALMLAVIMISCILSKDKFITIINNNKIRHGLISTFDRNSIGSVVDLNNTQRLQYFNHASYLFDMANTQNPVIVQLENKLNKIISSKTGNRYILIKKPNNTLSFSFEDLYMNKSIKITISNSMEIAFDNNLIERINGKSIFVGQTKDNTSKKNVSSLHQEGSTDTEGYGYDPVRKIRTTSKYNALAACYNTEITIKLDHIYAYETYEDDNFYVVSLKNTNEYYDRVLVIDAGHGGKDVGALSNNDDYYEKNINLDILLRLKELLDKKNIKVYYTRTSDKQVYLRPRAALANMVDCDLFISIHNNASEKTWPNGSEILYYDREYEGVNNKKIANVFLNELGKSIPLRRRGLVEVSKDNIFILKNAKVPAILIEVGYMTNHNDMYYLSNKENRKAIAMGIYNGIMKVYKRDIAQKEGKQEIR